MRCITEGRGCHNVTARVMPDATISASKERDWVMELIYEDAEKLAMKDNPLHG